MHFDLWTLVLQAANFLVLVWLLHRFLYRPVLGIIAARKVATDKLIADAQAEKKAAEDLKQSLESERATIAQERDTALKEAREAADADSKAVLAKLRIVVGAMRGIAAAHTQEARNALDGYRAYAKVISGGLARAIELLEPNGFTGTLAADGPSAAVVFTAEHGFAGAFTERVLDAVPGDEKARLFVAGSRFGGGAGTAGRLVDGDGEPGRRGGRDRQTCADALYSGFVEERFARADIVFAKLSGGSASTIVRKPILPIDLGAFRAPRSGPPPLTNLPPRRLIQQLVGEYVFAELALAALESFASENAARLETMASARLNIDQKLDELSGQERLLRQEQITAEVQEITSGALAAEGAGGL